MRGGLCELAGWLSLFSSSLGKIGSDNSLMAQQGLDEIYLMGGGSSSAISHKKTTFVELLVTLVRFNTAQLAGMYPSSRAWERALGCSVDVGADDPA